MAKKERVPKPTPMVRFPATDESPVSPGYMMPTRAPDMRESIVDPGQRAFIEQSVGAAGQKAFGAPITMDDAVAARVAAVDSAIKRSRETGLPVRGAHWYTGYRGEHEPIAQETGVELGRILDASGVLSPRNSPIQELKAARSAAFVAGNPNTTVEVTPAMSRHTRSGSRKASPLIADTYRIGDLSSHAIASLPFAETQVLKARHGGKAPTSERWLDRGVTDVTLRSAGRDRAVPAMEITRGNATLDTASGVAPKIHNFTRQLHGATTAEENYNIDVMARRDEMLTGTKDPDQPYLFQADVWLHNGEDGPVQPLMGTAEDYVMSAMSAQRAAAEGGSKVKASKAQDVVKPLKGKNNLDPSLDPTEMMHMFNEEATRRAAEQLSYTDGDVTLSMTPSGVQPVAWEEHRTHVLGEDSEYNAQQKAMQKAAAKEAKAAERAAKAKERAKAKGPKKGEIGEQMTLF